MDDEDKINDRATAVYVDPIIAKNKLNALVRSYDDKIFELKQSLIDYYIFFSNMKDQITLNDNVLTIYQKEFVQKKLELNLGKITENDLLVYEINLDNAKKDLDNANRDFNLTLMDFNYLIGNTLEIKYNPNYVDLSTISLEAIIERNISNDATIAGYKEDVEKYEAQKRVEHIYSSSVSAYKNYDQNIEDNKKDTDTQVKNLQFQAYTDYNDLMSLKLDVKIAQNNLILAQNALDVAKVKNNLGMITQLELAKAEKDLLSSKSELTKSLNSFYKSYQSFMRYY